MTELFLKTFEPISMSSQRDVSDTRTRPTSHLPHLPPARLSNFSHSETVRVKRENEWHGVIVNDSRRLELTPPLVIRLRRMTDRDRSLSTLTRGRQVSAEAAFIVNETVKPFLPFLNTLNQGSRTRSPTNAKANKVTDIIKETQLRQLLDLPYNYINENMAEGFDMQMLLT